MHGEEGTLHIFGPDVLTEPGSLQLETGYLLAYDRWMACMGVSLESLKSFSLNKPPNSHGSQHSN